MRGLTIGVAIAIDRYVLAVGITFLALFVLRVLGKMEMKGLEASENFLLTCNIVINFFPARQLTP